MEKLGWFEGWGGGFARRIGRRAAGFWLGVFFLLAQRVPWLTRIFRGAFVWLAVRFSPAIRKGTGANGRRILGRSPKSISKADIREFSRAVVGNFYDFVCDVAQSLRMSRAELEERIESIEGREKYLAARAKYRGAIILTAHLGSFEAGMAALLKFGEKIHVVFKRDTGRFEEIRQTMRKRLGVIEEPIDDGWGMWMRLRDALVANEIVAIQGDRVMPGQKGERVAFLGGHILLPSGPAKLAMASASPIIPVFSARTAKGKIMLFIEDPIIVTDDLEGAMKQIASVLAKYVAKYAQQWLVLHPAFCEDSKQHG